MRSIYKNMLLVVFVLFTFSGCQSIKEMNRVNEYNKKQEEWAKIPIKRVDKELLKKVDKIEYRYYDRAMNPLYQNEWKIIITKYEIDYSRGNEAEDKETYIKEIDEKKFNTILKSLEKNYMVKCVKKAKKIKSIDELQFETGSNSGGTNLKLFSSNEMLVNNYEENKNGKLCGDDDSFYKSIKNVMKESKTIATHKFELIKEPLEYEPISIYFKFDKSHIDAQDRRYLKSTANIISSDTNDKLYLELSGNTDAIGSDEYNYNIGLRRAMMIKKILVSYGVAKEKIITRSFGESNPLCRENTIECHTVNRRVEIQIREK